MKKVLLLLVDALSARHVTMAFDEGRLPNLNRLAERGQMSSSCISIFPSITPAATASIITGHYPLVHGIPGAFFYDTDQDRVHYFGDDLWAILRKGCGDFFNDFLIRLNEEVLSTETLLTRVERAGRRAASINYLIFDGARTHTVDVPWLLRLFPGVPWREEVSGPDLLCLGDFVAGRPHRDEDELSAPGGLFRRYGFQDESTAAFLLELAAQGGWRDLTVAYFPDNDFDSHDSGPTSALTTLETFDGFLAELFDACGGIDSLLADTTVLITGDHSQSDLVADKNARGILIEDLLRDFDIVPAGATWDSDDQLMACPNMRACQIYLRRNGWSAFDRIIEPLQADRRVDQIIWRTKSDGDGERFHVANSGGGELVFWQADSDGGRATDVFGNRWDWDGSLDPVAAEVSAGGRLQYSDYPNALERIATSFSKPAGGDLWVTARLGHEFHLADTKLNDCGSHGSLHAHDSLSPLIMAGAAESVTLPNHVRSVDVATLCLRNLGL